jgi:hypothetical protein
MSIDFLFEKSFFSFFFPKNQISKEDYVLGRNAYVRLLKKEHLNKS